jgi:hypothetical protein
MAQFSSIIKELLNTSRSGPSANFTWAAEAVFANPEAPASGMIATVDVFSSQEEAQQCVVQLTIKCDFNFLTFRARPMRRFHDFYDTSPVVLLTDDEKMNAAILERLKVNQQREILIKQREAIAKAQAEQEDKLGTPANVARLVHLCSQNRIQAIHNRKQAEQAETSYAERLQQLKASLKERPEVSKEWLIYITPILQALKDTSGLENMKHWWQDNAKELGVIDEDHLPLPVEQSVPKAESSS